MRLACRQSKSGLARQAEIERTTLNDMLAGRTWPDAITLAKLEQALETRWGDHPVTNPMKHGYAMKAHG